MFSCLQGPGVFFCLLASRCLLTENSDRDEGLIPPVYKLKLCSGQWCSKWPVFEPRTCFMDPYVMWSCVLFPCSQTEVLETGNFVVVVVVFWHHSGILVETGISYCYSHSHRAVNWTPALRALCVIYVCGSTSWRGPTLAPEEFSVRHHTVFIHLAIRHDETMWSWR